MFNLRRGPTHGVSAALIATGTVLAAVVLLMVVNIGGGNGPRTDAVRSDAGPLLAPGLGVPAMATLGAFDASLATAEARRTSPAAFAERVRSRHRFSGLSSQLAGAADRSAFPVLVKEQADEAPRLRRHERLLRYVSATTAELQLPDGRHGIVESLMPMATQSRTGTFQPLNLELHRTPRGYAPTTTGAPVEAPAQLQDGIRATATATAITPISSQGVALRSTGTAQGASVLYPNTQRDADTLAKPTSTGFELSTILRSPSSPRVLRYQLSAPSVDAVVQPTRGGAIEVESPTGTRGRIAPARAVDASGAPVSVSTTLAGREIVVDVTSNPSDIQWPVVVDPTYYYVNDSRLAQPSNWQPMGNVSWCSCSGVSPEIKPRSSFAAGEYGGIVYYTHPGIDIYFAEDWTEGQLNGQASTFEQFADLVNGVGYETNSRVISAGEGYNLERKLCATNPVPEGASCTAENGYSNEYFDLYAAAKTSGAANAWVFNIVSVKLYMADYVPTTASFSTTTPTIEKAHNRDNVFAGAKSRWIGPNHGAFQVNALNPGAGLEYDAVEEKEGGSYKIAEDNYTNGNCKGSLCPPTPLEKAFTYEPAMREGEHKLTFVAVGSDNSIGEETQTLKVDARPPEGLEVKGWPENREIGSNLRTLTIAATDGTQPTASSGVKQIAVALDGGKPTIVPEASCAPGPCTAAGKYTLASQSMPEGAHTLIVTAIDNAGNEAKPISYTFDIRRPVPIRVGPGTVDPSTGQFELSATDVGLAATNNITRTYRSRETAGESPGPLGPGWLVSLGGSESLEQLPEGNVALTTVTGARTTFQAGTNGEFVSPLGNQNLKLKAKEPEPGHGVTEYLLSDTHGGTTTRFTQPAGTQDEAPEYSGQFGRESAEFVPGGVATDKTGAVWMTDAANDRLLKFNRAGEFEAQYGTFGTGSAQMHSPQGLAINPTTGNIYVSDAGNDRVDEFKENGEFVQAFGFDVTGNQAFGACTTQCQAGEAADQTGRQPQNGAFKTPSAIAVDAGGNVWVTDTGFQRIQEFTAAGAFAAAYGSEGSGHVQFKMPTGIAYSSGNLYVAEAGNDRIQEISPAGVWVAEFGTKGSGAGELAAAHSIATDPNNGRLYVTDPGAGRVYEYSPTGSLITSFGAKAGSEGAFSDPNGVTATLPGEIYVSDGTTDSVQIWGRMRWLPTTGEGALPSGKTTYSYEAVKIETGRTEVFPREVLAPTPTHVSCGTSPSELKPGCRALLLTYGKNKAASGEGPSQWGEYPGRLARVELAAYNPASGFEKMEAVPVAEYVYDSQGRLRAEWDPRVTPKPLKTTYGYDSEGHLTAITPPGQETWELAYGTTAMDPNKGRLLKVTRAPASSQLWTGKAPEPTEQPVLTGTATVGATLKASSGRWANEPTSEPKEALSYGYQWERCNATGAQCTPIPGATNPTYTALVNDAQHELVVRVTATNGGGSTVAMTNSSAVISGAGLAWAETIGGAGTEEKQLHGPAAVATSPSGNVWVADAGNHRLQEFTASGGFQKAVGWGVADGKGEFETCTEHCKIGIAGAGAGQLADPEGIAINPKTGLIYVADAAENHIEVFTSEGAPLQNFAYYGSENSQHLLRPHGIAIAPSGDVYVADTGNGHLVRFSEEGKAISWAGSGGRESGQFESIIGVTTVEEQSGQVVVYTTDKKNNRIREYTSGVFELVREFGEAGSGKGQLNGPWAIIRDPVSGNLLVSSYNDGRVEMFTLTGVPVEEFGSAGSGKSQFSGPDGLARGPGTAAIYIADEYNNRVDVWAPGGLASEPLQPAPTGVRGAVNTIEYGVPDGGPGAPYQLANGATEAWGQKSDLPSEGSAIAILPPGKLAAWPTQQYEGATITYLDERGRVVDTAAPTGGISTAEYNDANAVTRTLSADNRAKALAKGEGNPARSAEISNELDTESKYASNGELEETLGPEHNLKLVHGREGKPQEVRARTRTEFRYDENAPAGPEGLLTKETVSALAGGEEFDKHTTTIGYSGQSGFGWVLRKATSTTTDPAGLDLTTTTEYDPNSGNPAVIRRPGRGPSVPPTTSGVFGALGTGAGQVTTPTHAAVDSYGDIWVSDTGNNRIEEFSSAGSFIKTFGWGVEDGEAQLEVCSLGCRAGIGGTESVKQGQLLEPTGIAWDPSTGDIYVANTGDNVISVFNTQGKRIKIYGKEGIGKNRFKRPEGLAVANSGNIWVADRGNRRLVELSAKGKWVGIAGTGEGDYADIATCTGTERIWATDATGERVDAIDGVNGTVKSSFGGPGTEEGDFRQISGIGCDKVGHLYVADKEANHVSVFGEDGKAAVTFGSTGSGEGQLSAPTGIAISSNGTIYTVDSGNSRILSWMPAKDGAQDTRTTYYTANGEALIPACQNHPEWADLTCQTEPLQPTSKPTVPTVTYTYNVWDEPDKVSEHFGGVERKRVTEYDGAGRVTGSAVTSTEGTIVPPVTTTYDEETGAVRMQTTSSGAEPGTIATTRNTVGAVTSYTDAAGGKTTYEYSGSGAESLAKVIEPHGSTTYHYNETTGLESSVTDAGVSTGSGLGEITGTYDSEGKLLTEGFPNKLVARYEYNELGEATGIRYEKQAHCAAACPEVWYSDTTTDGVSGETLLERATDVERRFTVDGGGRTTELDELPTGGGCHAELYAYDQEGNRTTETSRESAGSTCPSEGGTIRRHTYDGDNRLVDTGITYDAFGDATQVPAGDAEEHALNATYFVDGQTASVTQNGTTLSYQYDPLGRQLEVVTGPSRAVDHYGGGDSTASWLAEGGTWTRNVPGVDGALTGMETSAGAVTIELHDLHGDIVASTGINEAETAVQHMYRTSPSGVPVPGKTPPMYGWGGAGGLTTEYSRGITLSVSGGAAYVPQTARALQTAPIETPGACPVACGESAPYVPTVSAAANATAEQYANQVFEEEAAARQKAEAEAGEGAGEEGESTLGDLPLEPAGHGAHAAGHIGCAVVEKNGLPHKSTHAQPENLVNWTILFACNAPVLNVRLRLALYWEGQLASETGYVPVGDTAFYKLSVQTSCISGWYTGWVSAELTPPPGYKGDTKFKHWSKASRYVNCKT